MEIYLVGGAVRDELLGLPVKEKDWVVVGSTPEEMLTLGYKPVGKDFPVFLHPKTREEYALARTERKVSKGYTGFKFYADPKVTLEDDLRRRDLTINAIAKTLEGKIIDPYNGVTDLKNKILRHVSDAFAEDPVRILRAGRFAARFEDFTVHQETMRLMQTMVVAGEVDALVPERVWQELQRTLELPNPQRFFEVLKDCGALEILFPEIAARFESAIKISKKAAARQTKTTIKFAALTSCLTLAAIKSLYQRLNVPRRYKDLAILVAKYQHEFHSVLKFDAEQTLTLLEKLDAFRRPQRFNDFVLACEISVTKEVSSQVQKLRKALEAAQKVQAKSLLAQGLTRENIKAQLHLQRQQAIAKQ